MLKRLLRVLAVALLALTVPVQGAAAVSAGLCMTLGHHDGADVHAHAASDAQHVHPGGHDDTGGTAKGGAHDAHCPPCVSCCAAAAISSFPPLLVQQEPGFLPVGEPSPFFAGVVLENPDRPPLAL